MTDTERIQWLTDHRATTYASTHDDGEVMHWVVVDELKASRGGGRTGILSESLRGAINKAAGPMTDQQVTPEDREAAERILATVGTSYFTRESLITAFQAHAEQARQQERERCAKLACVGCRIGEPTRKLPYPNCIVVHYDAARPEEKMYRRECRAVELGILEGR